MEGKWKAIATIGIWIGFGISCAFTTPEAADNIAVSAALATILMWIFGEK